MRAALVVGLVALAALGGTSTTRAQTAQTAQTPSDAQIRNATYPVDLDVPEGRVSLIDGKATIDVGGAPPQFRNTADFQIVQSVHGRIGGADVAAVVLGWTNAWTLGNHGAFSLYVVGSDGRVSQTQPTIVGIDIVIISLAIDREGRIEVRGMERDLTQCLHTWCADVPVIQTWTLRNGKLTRLETPTPARVGLATVPRPANVGGGTVPVPATPPLVGFGILTAVLLSAAAARRQVRP